MQRFADLLLMRESAHREKVLTLAIAGFLLLTGMGLLNWVSSEVAIMAGVGWTLFLITVLIDTLARHENDLAALSDVVQQNHADNGGLIRVYSHVGEVPWHDLFRNSSRVQIVARFFNNIIAQPQCAKALEEFFARDGRIEVVIPSPDSPEIIKVLERQRQPDGMPSESMAARIVHSISQLEQCRVRSSQSSDPSGISVSSRQEILNYSGFRFDDDLVFAAYEHHYLTSVGIPLMHFDLRRSETLREFWDQEFSYLTQPRERLQREASSPTAFLTTHA